jgi:hypothetical protein
MIALPRDGSKGPRVRARIDPYGGQYQSGTPYHGRTRYQAGTPHNAALYQGGTP